jgi:DNA-directed RNA polymerase subunit beta
MNIGQIMDIHGGLVAKVLGFKLSADAYNSISLEELHTLMSLTVDLMNSTGDPHAITSQYKTLPSSFLEHCCQNIENIRLYAGCFDKEGTTKVLLPGNDGKLTETKILVGYIYVFKLIQEAHKKVHARAGETYGEAYGEITDAPTHGSSKGGGQRYGTMEIDALCAMGASGLIRELTNERCDNAIARNNFYVNNFLPPALRKQYHIDSPGQRRSVTQFLYSMLSLGIMCEPMGHEFIPLSPNNGAELAHWKPSVIQRANMNYMTDYRKKDEDKDESAESAAQDQLVMSLSQLIRGSQN